MTDISARTARRWRGAALAALPLLAAQAPPASLQALDAGFACPESLASDAARMTALRSFFDAYARLKPDATPQDVIAYRHLLLEKHHCAQTLAHVDRADRAVATGSDVRAQAWLPIDRHDGLALAVSPSHLTPTVDPRLPDDKAVDAFARITLSSPAVTDATHTRYDEVVSHAVYFCRARRYALIENDYYLGGREVLKEPGAVVAHTAAGAGLVRISEIPPGSLNAEAADWACASVRGAAS